jgi:chitin synthase
MQAHYYIAFSILSTALEDPSFGLKGINIANIILNYFYLGLLIMCFILALGNRPQGSKWGYTLAIVGFALITIYMTVSALVLAFKGLDQLEKEHKGSLGLGDFFQGRDLPEHRVEFGSNIRVIRVCESALCESGTLSLDFFVLTPHQFEPWHLITSFAQYTLMAPSYINVLNVYAVRDLTLISSRP